MSDELKTIDISGEESLQHYGRSVMEGAPGVGSGRYPLGSGEAAYQRQKNFRTTVASLRKAGMSQEQIAKHLQFKNTSELRARISKNKEEVHAYEVAMAKKLKAKGMSTTAIAERMYKDKKKESTVRNLLAEGNAHKDKIFEATTKALKEELETHPYLDVGVGAELYLGVSQTRLKNVLNQMEREGYKVHPYIQVKQYGVSGDQKTTIKVLTKDDVSDRDIYQHLGEVKPAGVYSEDRGETFRKIEPPASIDPSRVYIKYAEDGGTKKDGVIELRRCVEDLSLGNANYAQVRIAVGGTHYLKGMALYSDNIPDGYDVVFNTNKHSGTPMIDGKKGVLKPMKDDPANPFGASIKTEDQLILSNESEGSIRRQRHYIGKDGQEHLSAINIVNEEGNWNEWSRSISAQMLSKQPPALAKRQLDITYQLKREQLNDILSLTNPTVKKKMLEQFADKCESDAVHLKAFGFPGQSAKVILPVDTLPDNQCYCPAYENGTQVVLIRYPHAGTFEIPALTVNNNHKDGKKILGQAIDGIGINSRVAEHLSGADFDGDTVYVIPNNRNEIKHAKQLIENFDPKEEYPGYPGMKKMTARTKGIQMGVTTNLITDMTVAGAPMSDMIKAVKHSMVVIDAEKHGLDWKRSEKENDIQALKEKYQTQPNGHVGGATTLLSKAKSTVRVEDVRYKGVDKETGKKIFEPTGKTNFKGELKTHEEYQMNLTDDARTLISKYNNQMERIYADYANRMKGMALEARKTAIATPALKRNPEARTVYAAEVESLTAKLRRALKNKPLERQAQILTDVEIKQRVYDNPSLKEDKDGFKKLKGRTLTAMRERTGALKDRVTFTDNEWKAVQAGAVSDTFFRRLLDNADDRHVKQLAMPKERAMLTGARKSRVRQLLNNGYTQAEIASMLDISKSSVEQVAIEMR